MAAYVQREIEPVLLEYLRQFPAAVVTGPRQSGKSTLLREVLPRYTYRTLDDPQLRQLALRDPELFLDSLGEQGIVDEIQYAPGLLSYVKMRIDRERDRCGRFVFTGSQQFPLIKDLGETLAGRIGVLELLPFSLAEKRQAPALAPGLSTTRAAFEHACLAGSFPEPALRRALRPADWFGSYVQTYLERDVRGLYDIGHLRDFERFLQLLAGRCAQVLNLSTYARELGVAVNTVKRWLSVLEACRITFLLPPYHTNLGKRITQAPKVYFLDCALVCYLTGLRDAEHLLQGPMAGPLFETFCIQEAVKAFLNRGQRPRLYYLRTQAGVEVDLLAEGAGPTLYPFEFKLTQTPKLSLGDALTQFRRTFADLHPEPGTVVCLADEDRPLSREIEAVSVSTYLARLGGVV